jgi:TonB-linked SusC/RagA family outer membrane protein
MKKIDDGAIKKLALIVVAGFALANPVFSQTPSTSTTQTAPKVNVSGKVVDSDGKPLAGVSVLVQGTTNATQTAEDGTFKLSAPEGGKLSFTRVNMKYKSYSLTGNKSDIVITMEQDKKDMDEVVVIGYGTQKQKNLTGAIVSVDTKKMEDMPVATVTEALRGQVPGVNVVGGSTRPGTAPTINIRQQFSFGKDGSSPNPLIIIDDVIQVDPQTGLASMDQFNLLDLSEVESITVLKDASAAIYGSRASQGAIVIKTKRGKIGAPRISYSGKFETNDAISHGKVMNAHDFGIYSNRMGRALNWTAANMFDSTELVKMDSLNYDWLGDAWKPANAMQHSLNVSGGSDRATYYAGAAYYTQGANLGSQDYKRYSFRSGLDVKVANNLKLSATIAAQNSDLEKSFTKTSVNDGYANGGEQNDYGILLHMPKYIPYKYNVNGTDYFISPAQSAKTVAGNVTSSQVTSINYFALLNNNSKTFTNNFGYNANFSLQYDFPFIKGLAAKVSYAIAGVSGRTEQNAFAPILERATNTNTVGNHLYSSPTLTWATPAKATTGSRVTYDNKISKNVQQNFYLTYDHSFGRHNVSAMAGVEKATNNLDDSYQLYASPNGDVYTGTSFSSLGTLDPTNSLTTKYAGGSLSYLGRVSYNYANKYMAQFVFRSDASTHFAPENYWGFFPGVSAGWVISEENWFKDNVSWVDNLKLRASLGKTGNDNVKAWKWMQVFDLTQKGIAFGSTNGGTYTYAVNPSVTPNRDIKWDYTIQRNIGLDFAVLRSRLAMSVDYYYNSNHDIITALTDYNGVPVTEGGSFADMNYMSLNFWGSEISATWRDNVGKVNYTIGMNFGFSDNKITKYFDRPFDYPSLSTTRTQVGNSTITPAWGFRTWKQTSSHDGIMRNQADVDAYWQYLSDNAAKAGNAPSYIGITDKTAIKPGMLAYEDVAGNKDLNSKTVAGPNGQIVADQDYVRFVKKNRTYGITTNLGLTWKGISFLAQIGTSWGGINKLDYIKQATGSSNFWWSQPVYLKDMFDPTDNPNGKYPSLAYYDSFGGTNSDFFLMPTFRMVVRSMSVGYTIPAQVTRKAKIENARVFISGMNLWDLYNPYPNHYRNMYDAPTVTYPTLRTWALGVNLGF